MHRKNIIVVGLFLLIMFLNGCDYIKEPGRYFNRKHNYSIIFPDGWQKANTSAKGAIAYVSLGKVDLPDGTYTTAIVANVYISVLTKPDIEQGKYPIDLEQYTKRIKAEKTPNVDFLVGERRALIGGVKGKVLFFEKRLYLHTYVDVVFFAIVDKDKIYHITFSTLNNNYLEYENVFKKCIESFRFENRK